MASSQPAGTLCAISGEIGGKEGKRGRERTKPVIDAKGPLKKTERSDTKRKRRRDSLGKHRIERASDFNLKPCRREGGKKGQVAMAGPQRFEAAPGRRGTKEGHTNIRAATGKMKWVRLRARPSYPY